MSRYGRAMMASLGFAMAATAFAQGTPSTVPAQKGTPQQCKDLTGSALDACLKAGPGSSSDATSRDAGRTPGSSADSASRTGVPPGQARGASDAAAGATAGSGAMGKSQGSEKSK